MSDYRFSTVRIIPDLIRGEPLNIGVILHDVDNSTIYRRFTKNWTEVKRRAGIERLPHANGPASIGNKEFLDALSAKAGKNNLVVTKPKPVSPINTPQETLDVLFKVQVSLPERSSAKRSAKGGTLQKFCRSLDATIQKMGFPAQSYERGYAFEATVVDRRFPYAFFKDRFPHLCIDYLSFSKSNVLDITRNTSLDIELIRKSQRKSGIFQTDFKVFSEQDRDEVDASDGRVRNSLEVLELSGIQTVYRKDHVYELDRIHKIVSVTA